MKKDFFTRSDPNWRSDGACNDDLAGFQRLAEHGKKICNVTDVVDELASEGLQGLRVVEAVDLGAVAKDAAGEALKIAADAPGVEITPVPVLGHRGRGWTTHCEVRYTGVRVSFEPRMIWR